MRNCGLIRKICCDTQRQLINQLILSNSLPFCALVDWCIIEGKNPGKFALNCFYQRSRKKCSETASLNPWFLLLLLLSLVSQKKLRLCCFAGIDCGVASACRFKNKFCCRFALIKDLIDNILQRKISLRQFWSFCFVVVCVKCCGRLQKDSKVQRVFERHKMQGNQLLVVIVSDGNKTGWPAWNIQWNIPQSSIKFHKNLRNEKLLRRKHLKTLTNFK